MVYSCEAEILEREPPYQFDELIVRVVDADGSTVHVLEDRTKLVVSHDASGWRVGRARIV